MKKIGNLLIIIGVVLISYFGYQYISLEKAQNQTLAEAQNYIKKTANSESNVDNNNHDQNTFTADQMEAFGTLEIPKLGNTIGIVEGADEDALSQGVGHMSETAFPGQGEQIVLSGHRDTVFRNFDQLEIGDTFIVNMPYGKFEYKILETEIVPEDDTSVVGKMGEEVLVVSTCYPFHFVGDAPDRFVAYAYPI
ncbi:class D sortase [Virgibacillus oceani]